MNATLVPAVVETAVKPKPTKRELIEAMARVQIEKLEKERQERAEKRAVLDAEIELGLKALLHRRGASKFKVSAYFNKNYGKAQTYYANLNFSFSPEDLGEALMAKMKARDEASDICIPSLADAKKQIVAKMNELTPADARVDALLDSPECRKAIEKMLESLE